MLQYCFAGEACPVPPNARDLLAKLQAPNHALCNIAKKGKNILHVATWPSWLNKGYKRHVDIFQQVFYAEGEAPMKGQRCKLCKVPIKSSLWNHVFYECKSLIRLD
jgi:hypothetical protein